MSPEGDDRFRRHRAQLAPGTELRSGLERVLRARTGALVVLGSNKTVEQISTGGYTLNIPFTETDLRELAKLDGAIVLSDDCSRILTAGVHLMPDRALKTTETGTRHRTADRVTQQSGRAVVAVSASMGSIMLFLSDRRTLIEPSMAILARANLALQTLERYQHRLKEALSRLSDLEVQEEVTIRDLVWVGQRLEMVRRMQDETRDYVAELGTDGRFIDLQLLEAAIDVPELETQLDADYRPEGLSGPYGFELLTELNDTELMDPLTVSQALGLTEPQETNVSARGYRQLATVPRLPPSVAQRLVEHFGGLQAMFGASTSDLRAVDGVGDGRARLIRNALTRVAESPYQTFH